MDSAASKWVDQVVGRAFAQMHQYVPENFDSDRYSGISPQIFRHEFHAKSLLFLVRNAESFHRARGLLQDDESAALYDELLLYRILGPGHVRLSFNTAENRTQIAQARSWQVEDCKEIGILGHLAWFEIPRPGGMLRVKGWADNIVATFLDRQYYFQRGAVSIMPDPGDHVVDAGGCFGDTAIGFAEAVGGEGRVYVFDPLPKHCAITLEQLAASPGLADRISVISKALGSVANDLPPMPPNDAIDPGAILNTPAMLLSTIDEAVSGLGAPRIDFIKMDIEGSEFDALCGGENTLRRWRPKLAISLYHRSEDFFTIPLWIDSLGLGYKFYIDHYSIHQEETILYAAVSN